MTNAPNSDENEQPVVRELDASHPVTITLPLHEVLRICLFYAQAPAETLAELRDNEGTYYGFSAAYGISRLTEELGRLFGNEETLDEIVVARALLDQRKAEAIGRIAGD